MIRVRTLWLVMLSAACLAGSSAIANDAGGHCGSSPEVTTLDSAAASAGFLANAGNREDSIRATSSRMLTSAIEKAQSDTSAQRIIFKSIPELSKKTTSDDEMCERQEAATSAKPLEFGDKRFAGVDELNDWIMDFTQGKGTEGKSLYKQCPGKCSPQYTWWIEPQKSELLVNARVICGRPRDRDGNKYQLSIALTPACPVAAAQ